MPSTFYPGALAGQLCTDARTKDCKTYPKECDRHFEIDSVSKVKKIVWSIKKSGEALSKSNRKAMNSREFRATSVSTYDISILYTTLPHNFIEEKLLDVI